MEDEAELQEVFRIWPYEDSFLEVFVDGDGMVRIKTTTPKSEEYFGKMDVSLEKKTAKKLAEALKVLT